MNQSNNVVFLCIDRIAGLTRYALHRTGNRHHPVLVGDSREWTEKDSFDPTIDGGVGANPQSQAKDRKDGKPGAAAKHPKTKPDVLRKLPKHSPRPGVTSRFLHVGYASNVAQGCNARRVRRFTFLHSAANIDGDVRFDFFIEVLLQPVSMEQVQPTLQP